MAYVLGFFAADGSMIRNNRGACFIEFKITDRSILLKIKQALGSNHKISRKTYSNDKWKTTYRLQIGSKEIFKDLTELGFSQKKSKKMKLPFVPIEFWGHFVRGYFDGDGNVHFKQYYAKDRGKKRWSFSTCFTSGSKIFLRDLHKSLSPFVKGGFLHEKKTPDKKIKGYSLVFSHQDGLALFRLMYNNGCRGLCLRRKYLTFKKAIKTLGLQL